MSHVVELNIDFAGAQVTCRTDSDEVADRVRHIYWPMLVNDVRKEVGVFEILKQASGFSLSGAVKEESNSGPDHALNWLRPRVLQAFMDFRTDLLWLHSAVVAREEAATLIIGPSASGKSTMATLLCQRGWRFLSDEVAPISVETMEVLAYPQAPSRRRRPRIEVSPDDVNHLDRLTWRPPESLIRHSKGRFDTIVFIEFSFDAGVELKRLSPGVASLELLKNNLNFPRHRDEAVCTLAEVARSTPCYSLVYGNPEQAASKIDSLGQADFTCFV